MRYSTILLTLVIVVSGCIGEDQKQETTTTVLQTTLSTTTVEGSSPVVEEEALPDFKVESSDIVVSNLTPKSGDVIDVNVTVWNIGDAEANVTVMIYHDGWRSKDTSVVIGAGENITLSSLVEVWESGNHTIEVVVDPYYFVTERDKSNNRANKTLTVSLGMVMYSLCMTDKLYYKQKENGIIQCYIQNHYDWTPLSVDSITADINGTKFNLTQPTTLNINGKEYNLTQYNLSNLYTGVFTTPSKPGIYAGNITVTKTGYANDTAYIAFKVLAPN